MADATPQPLKNPGARLALLAFAQFIVAMDYNIVYVALPDIGKGLGFSTQSLQWVISAYLVALGGFLLFGGRAVDRIGPRRIFITGLIVYGVFSLLGGLASEPWMLVCSRAAQGIGGALLFPATLALIFVNFSEGSERNRAMGVWGATGSAGLSAGSLLGGVLTSWLHWEAVFFVNVPLTFGAALVALRLLRPDAPRRASAREFDIPGAVVVTASATLLVFGLSSGPAEGWNSGRTVGTLIGGLVLLGLFLLVESRTGNPLMPLRLLRNRMLLVAMAVIFIFQGTLGGTYYLYTSYLQSLRGYTAFEAGLSFLPLTLISMVAALRFAPKLLARWGMRTTLVAGMVVTGIGIALLAAGMSARGSFPVLLPGIVVWGLGGGVVFPVMFVAASSGAAPTEQGVVSAIASTGRQVGGAVILAATVAVVTATNTGHGASSGFGSVDGLRVAGLAAGALTLVGGLFALALRKPPPRPPASNLASVNMQPSVKEEA